MPFLPPQILLSLRPAVSFSFFSFSDCSGWKVRAVRMESTSFLSFSPRACVCVCVVCAHVCVCVVRARVCVLCAVACPCTCVSEQSC